MIFVSRVSNAVRRRWKTRDLNIFDVTFDYRAAGREERAAIQS